jgi:osmotically-inducible protein OsmY
MERARIMSLLGALACLILLLVVGAFPSNNNQPGARQTRDGCSTASDKTIKDNIIAALRNHRPPIPGIEDTFHVKVEKGFVTIKGKVESSGDARNIIYYSEHVEPALCVKDIITSDLGISCSDAKATSNAKNMLTALPCANSIAVTVRKGVATLTGSVTSSRYKWAAKHLVEVADCVNTAKPELIAISPPSAPVNCATITDDQLKGLVESTIRSKFSCLAIDRVRVSVANKVVTLRGTTTVDAKPLIVRAAENVPCVARVIDQMGREGPACPGGAIACTTLDGEQWCCYGCRLCPRTW